jgi:hypothetical protein
VLKDGPVAVNSGGVEMVQGEVLALAVRELISTDPANKPVLAGVHLAFMFDPKE